MIIGNGTIANLFRNYSENKEIVFFASGVSNSLENDEKEFQREIKLLEKTINDLNPHQNLIYFSTINVLDPSLQNNRYVIHKKKIEEIISTHTKNYLIFRVPVLIVQSDNPHLLINYLLYHIKNKIEFVVFKNAHRYFLNAETFVQFVEHYIQHTSKYHEIINLTLYDEPFSVLKLVNIIEELLNIKSIYEIVEKGAYYKVPNDHSSILNNKFTEFSTLPQNEYIKNSILKIIQYGNI